MASPSASWLLVDAGPGLPGPIVPVLVVDHLVPAAAGRDPVQGRSVSLQHSSSDRRFRLNSPATGHPSARSPAPGGDRATRTGTGTVDEDDLKVYEANVKGPEGIGVIAALGGPGETPRA
jgi:hypothetical protein